MVLQITMQVEGLEAVVDTVRDAASREKMEQAVDDLGEIGFWEAVGLCPVLTGALRASINHVHSGLTSIVSVGLYYAEYQEFGTSHNAAHPFMRPAAEKVRSAANSIRW
jgi:HK97 gp10 family phage protein